MGRIKNKCVQNERREITEDARHKETWLNKTSKTTVKMEGLHDERLEKGGGEEHWSEKEASNMGV